MVGKTLSERVDLSKKRGKNRHAPGHDGAGDDAPRETGDAAAPDADLETDAAEVARLRDALAGERAARAALEERLQSLEQSLRRAESGGVRAARPAPEDLGVATLHALAGPDRAEARDYAGFEHWLMEASLRADAEAAPSHEAVPLAMLMPLVAEPASAAAAPQSVTEDRLLQRLRAAREALDSAEAKAAHNAAQVRRLTAELAAARTEHTRASTRVRALEARVATVEGRPLDPAALGAPVVLPAAAPPDPGLPPIHLDAPRLDAPHPEPPARDALDLEDALAAWGGSADVEAPPATLEDALAAWGGSDGEAAAPTSPAADAEFDRAIETLDTTSALASTEIEDALLGWDAPGLDAQIDVTLLEAPSPRPAADHPFQAIETPAEAVGEVAESVFDFDATPGLDLNDAPDIPEDDTGIVFVGADAAPDTEAVLEEAPDLAEAMLAALGAEALETPATGQATPSVAADLAEEALAAMAAPGEEAAGPEAVAEAVIGAPGGVVEQEDATPSVVADLAEEVLAAMAAHGEEEAGPDGVAEAFAEAPAPPVSDAGEPFAETLSSESLDDFEPDVASDLDDLAAEDDAENSPVAAEPVAPPESGAIAEDIALADGASPDVAIEGPADEPRVADDFEPDVAPDLDEEAVAKAAAAPAAEAGEIAEAAAPPDGVEIAGTSEPLSAPAVDDIAPEAAPVTGGAGEAAAAAASAAELEAEPKPEAEPEPAIVPEPGPEPVSAAATVAAPPEERRTSLMDALSERRQRPGRDAREAATSRPRRAVADSLQGWAGVRGTRPPVATESLPPESEPAHAPEESGDATMVDALLRFMRPK